MPEVVVSLTSWKKRIDNVSRTIFSLYNNTFKPRSIELNLSEEEFPNKEKDLPKDLLLMATELPININWVGKNTKSFKKIIPTIKKYFDEKELYLFSADDDVIYPKDILEKFIAINLKHQGTCCVCFGNCAGSLSKQPVVRGAATLYKIGFFTDLVWKGLTPEIIATNEDDWWYSYCFLKTGTRSISFTKLRLKFFNEQGKHQYNTGKTKRMYIKMIGR